MTACGADCFEFAFVVPDSHDLSGDTEHIGGLANVNQFVHLDVLSVRSQ